jgi:DNA-binding NtrC family response regulator
LLRVLQEREVRPIGSTRSEPVDVRILAATNRNLAEEVREKRFRSDLFFRLNVLSLRVPPLRERREDIPVLARHFLDSLTTGSCPANALSPEALLCLESYPWPGNVRELENAMRRALVLCRGPTVLPEDLPAAICRPQGEPAEGSLAAAEAAAIRSALLRAGRQRRSAARILGISESTLYRKIRLLGIEG